MLNVLNARELVVSGRRLVQSRSPLEPSHVQPLAYTDNDLVVRTLKNVLMTNNGKHVGWRKLSSENCYEERRNEIRLGKPFAEFVASRPKRKKERKKKIFITHSIIPRHRHSSLIGSFSSRATRASEETC